MKILIDFLNMLGLHININLETSPIVQFCIVILVLTIIALICCINIFLYCIVLYISENKNILNYINKYKIILKIFNFYKKTRLLYIVLEFIFLIVNLACIASLCLYIIYGVST
jgi:hypothetical protein